jgi:hypothetical protein
MGAFGRMSVAAGLVALTACGSAPKSGIANEYMPWLALQAAHQYVNPAQSPPPAPSVPPGTPRCTAGQVEGVGLASGVAAGNIDMPLLLRNKSGAACYVMGFADVTVLDATGHTVAQSSGFSGRGTFFADAPVTPVLMAATSPPLPRPFTTRDGSQGQAFMNFSWYDCTQPVASTLVIGLPEGGGSFLMPYPTGAATNPMCQGDGSSREAIFRGPLTAAGSLWPYIDVEVEVNAPRQAKAGSRLMYFVTVTNQSPHAYDLKPCPDYGQYILKSLVSTYQLNCKPVGSLAPGKSVTFEMRVDISASAATGASEIAWCLIDGRIIGGGCGFADITIT